MTLKRIVTLVPCLALLAGCGGKARGSAIVTTGGAAPSTGTLLGVYRIPSESMAPTLTAGDRVPVETGKPRLGEIVVFHPPEGAAEEKCGSGTSSAPGGAPCSKPGKIEDSNVKFIKRIVAGPGDTIKVVEGHVIRNGKRVADRYIRPCPGVAECNFPVAIKVPEGDWYLLGDNRGESDDSRFWWPVPTSWVIGVAKG